MELKSFTINNYKSIESLSFDISQLEDKSFTYSLIGENEAGKSSILQALALKDDLLDLDNNLLPNQQDFRENEDIRISYLYRLSELEIYDIYEKIQEEMPEIHPSNAHYQDVILHIIFKKSQQNNVKIEEIEIENAQEFEHTEIIKKHYQAYVLNNQIKAVFWKSEDNYLMSHPVNLTNFSNDPDAVSIPLKNCFKLAGFSDISAEIAKINESTAREYLADQLGKEVTDHINRVWKDHPIKITFNISGEMIHFHVKDKDVKGRAKTAGQRSDGFRQFISFLLTVSAESKAEQLQNTLLLLDEPETHLHPKAQHSLLENLIEITKNNKNNIALFATHSNYMIDQEDLSRSYKIYKLKDITKYSGFDKKKSTYAEINYDVFSILSSDYHNELYGKIQETINENCTSKLDDFFKKEKIIEKSYFNSNTDKTHKVSLPTYIRHQIHHPENSKNTKFTKTELVKSINFLLKIMDSLPTNTANGNPAK